MATFMLEVWVETIMTSGETSEGATDLSFCCIYRITRDRNFLLISISI